MRKLETSDVFAACRCLKAIGAKEKIKETAQKADRVTDVWGNGFDLLWDIFDAATEADGEDAIYRFLAGPLEMTSDEVRHMPVALLFDNVKALAEENDLLRFFKSAAGLMK